MTERLVITRVDGRSWSDEVCEGPPVSLVDEQGPCPFNTIARLTASGMDELALSFLEEYLEDGLVVNFGSNIYHCNLDNCPNTERGAAKINKES